MHVFIAVSSSPSVSFKCGRCRVRYEKIMLRNEYSMYMEIVYTASEEERGYSQWQTTMHVKIRAQSRMSGVVIDG